MRTDVSKERIASSASQLLVTTNVVPRLLILSTFPSLLMEALLYSETSVLTRDTRLQIPEDDILRSHCRENLKSRTIRNFYLHIMLYFCILSHAV
jgi:hypothetical protein